jgi:ABC-type dipeptide/oligopeptide/nickel transport system ATPase subunit
MTRTFELKEATREAVPLMIGLIGPSGSGKTFSALRLATGIQRVSPGPIAVIDTESRRATHYADLYHFQHLAFGAPFSSLDYLDAIQYVVDKGARTVIVDSMSHEHEGAGGCLEEHDAEAKRLAKAWNKSEYSVQFPAWAAPKAKRQRLINTILQLPINGIFCFRAKEKLKMDRGKDKGGNEPVTRGIQPIAGEAFIYEMTINLLLYPGAGGIPTLATDIEDEKLIVKTPRQFVEMFRHPRQLDEDTGEAMARWAAGTSAPVVMSAAELVSSYQACSDSATYRTLEASRKLVWPKFAKEDRDLVMAAAKETYARIHATGTAASGEAKP